MKEPSYSENGPAITGSSSLSLVRDAVFVIASWTKVEEVKGSVS
jgi:hypothetical protein